MTHPNQRPHNNNTGRFEPSQAAAEKAAQAARLKAENPRLSYQQIADAVGYNNKSDAWRAIQRCREAVIREAGAELIASEAQQLDDLFVAALEVLGRDHLTVSHGHIVRDDDGHPIIDDGPKLSAIDRLLRIRESYRKLFGADQAIKVDATVHEVTQQDIELAELIHEAQAKNATEEARIKGEAG
jgi:hypothetical protein